MASTSNAEEMNHLPVRSRKKHRTTMSERVWTHSPITGKMRKRGTVVRLGYSSLRRK